ncbi:hypothetical protein ACVWZV_004535 [Bradyrhizobium sp. GM5.1]
MEPGGVTSQKIANFNDYLSAYKAVGLNTITLVTWVPVDPQSGQIESSFKNPAFGETAQTPAYLAAFTDAAHAAGMNVIWKPQFVLDNGTNNNVNEYFLGSNFYPNGTTFNVNTFLSNVQQFWSQWAPVAEQHNVEMLILGTEQGQFASAAHTQSWLNTIQTVRSVYSGELTYAENHFGPQPWEPNVQFWGALDVIGIDDYAPIGNGTANTAYTYAFTHIFQSLLDQGPTGIPESIPAILYNLHAEFNKPIFFTEFGTTSIDGAMNNPASTLVGNVNYAEQAAYFQANLDAFQGYDWIRGMNVWNQENEFSPGPSSSNWNAYFSQYLAGGYEFLGKPTAALLSSYWATDQNPHPNTSRAERFFDSATGDHFYTLSVAEANQIRATLPTYHDEGTPWSTPDRGTGTIDVFRFFDVATNAHFLTTSTAERDFIIAHTPTLHFEGVAFESYAAADAGTLTLERFFNTISGLHHYSASAVETASINGGAAGPGWVG